MVRYVCFRLRILNNLTFPIISKFVNLGRINTLCCIGFVVLHIVAICSAEKNCPDEYSTVITKNIRAIWKANPNAENEVVISEPACIDDNNNLITRICINGNWEPSRTPLCHTTSSYKGKCPDPFDYIEDHCVLITPPQTWKDANKFVTTFEKFLMPRTISNFVWLPIRRVVNYGPFEYTDVGDDYGRAIDIKFSNYQQFFGGNCLGYNAATNTTQPENCENLHQRVRQFHSDYQFYNCPGDCKPAGLARYKCYCTVIGESCESFAKISSSFDRAELVKLANNQMCRIGEIQPNSLSVRGLKPYVNGTTWRYGNFESNCSICETRALKIEPVNMVLSFEEKKLKLVLVIYSQENIFNDGTKYAVYCFTDASSHLKKKVTIKKVWEYEKGRRSRRSRRHSVLAYQLELENYMGQYWCEGFNLGMTQVTSNKVVAFRKKKGNEYALRIVLNNVCKLYSCDYEKFYEDFVDQRLKDIFFPFNAQLRIMEIFELSISQDYVDLLLHVSTGRKNANIVEEYRKSLERLKENLGNHMKIVYFRSSEWCLPENTVSNNFNLSWPLTRLGSTVLAEDSCLTQDDKLLARRCEGDFSYGAAWSDFREDCFRSPSVSETTQLLMQTLKNPQEVSMKDVASIVQDSENLGVLDIYYLSKILSRVRKSNDDINSLPYLLQIFDKILKIDSKLLKNSQNLLNLGDETLDSLEDFLSGLRYESEEVYFLQGENIVVHISNPFVSNVSGLILYGQSNSSLMELNVTNFERNATFENLTTTDLQLAVYVPETVLERIHQNTTNISETFLATIIYYNNSLFIDSEYDPVSYIISVTIPGYGSYLETPLPVLLRSQQDRVDTCAFWDNGKKTSKHKGKWSDLGANYLGNFNESSLYMCSFEHLTNFALLIMSDKNTAPEGETVETYLEDPNEHVLNIITIIGGTFSIAGICGIFLTALIFEKWRRKIGTKILLNLSIAILLETICVHLSEIESLRNFQESCKILGVTLHYVVLSKFCWMLIYAILQYLRFVRVMGAIPENLILKSIIFGWGTPLVLVLIVGVLTNQSYVSSSYELCYPRGILLYLTVLFPICLIIIANLTIFFLVMYEVTHSKIESSVRSSKLHKLQLYLAVLLFFVLGIPWVFGILAELLYFSFLKIVLFYLFCITATLQGFILFLFYVILNKETRTNWITYIKFKKMCR